MALPSERLEELLRAAIGEGASDLHLEPRDRRLEVRHRVDGRLLSRGLVEARFSASLVQAAKIAGHMDIAERRLPQDGQGEIAHGDRRYHLRFSSLPAVNGEALVIRIIDEHVGVRTFAEMGLLPGDIGRIRQLLGLPHGLVYVTGPTGAGKTTLLYAMLHNLPPDEIDALKIITLEDPVEARHPRFFLQVGVDDRIGRTFSELLRHVLRHDPDVLLIGETRDLATAEITLKAALTGHLCFSTLHTPDALGTIERLRDLGLDPLMVASALKGVIAQRLVRRPCGACARPHSDDGSLRQRFQGLLAPEAGPVGFLQPRAGGCPACHGRGYRGRTAIAEVFPLGGLERLVAKGARPEALLARLRAQGCATLFEDGVRKAALGLTTLEEVYAAVERPPGGGSCYFPTACPPP
jgi:type II secretory ATPase GspE/PulE/Tfp pilus assembly ATPase PilB-like protein